VNLSRVGERAICRGVSGETDNSVIHDGFVGASEGTSHVTQPEVTPDLSQMPALGTKYDDRRNVGK